jgi:hypothetical protein
MADLRDRRGSANPAGKRLFVSWADQRDAISRCQNKR